VVEVGLGPVGRVGGEGEGRDIAQLVSSTLAIGSLQLQVGYLIVHAVMIVSTTIADMKILISPLIFCRKLQLAKCNCPLYVS
jgi:hypothetical protein